MHQSERALGGGGGRGKEEIVNVSAVRVPAGEVWGRRLGGGCREQQREHMNSVIVSED